MSLCCGCCFQERHCPIQAACDASQAVWSLKADVWWHACNADLRWWCGGRLVRSCQGGRGRCVRGPGRGHQGGCCLRCQCSSWIATPATSWPTSAWRTPAVASTANVCCPLRRPWGVPHDVLSCSQPPSTLCQHCVCPDLHMTAFQRARLVSTRLVSLSALLRVMRQNVFSWSVERISLAGVFGSAAAVSSACRAHALRQRMTFESPVGFSPCCCGSRAAATLGSARWLATSSASFTHISASVTGLTFLRTVGPVLGGHPSAGSGLGP